MSETEAKPIGRPSDYTPDLAAEICRRLAEGQSVRTVCKAEDMPEARTVFLWLQRHSEFIQQYTRAKEESADAFSEDMLDIADDASNDWMERLGEEGAPAGWLVNGEHIQRSRLRIETRKWLASKLKPKKYGERTAVDVGNQDGKPFVLQIVRYGDSPT